MNGVMVFGFLSAFFACVFLGYRDQLKSRVPVIPASLACCATYGFFQGAWPLGFCLSFIAVNELRNWWTARAKPVEQIEPASIQRMCVSPSRLTRMFGSI